MKNKSRNFITDLTRKNSLICIRSQFIRSKSSNFNPDSKKKRKDIKKITKKLKKSCRILKWISKLISIPYYNYNKKIVNFTRIYTCQLMHLKKHSYSSCRLKETSKKHSISSDSHKVKEISIQLNSMKKTLLKGSFNTSWNKLSTNFTRYLNKKESESKKTLR